jgi:thiosulfate dehydrogenase [quinone] large subunit
MMVDRIDSRTSTALRQWPIVLLRVYAGVFFAYHGIGKLRHEDFASGLAGFLTRTLDSSFSFYRPFLESVVLPSKELFAALVAWGELAVGVALIVGLATRYAAFTGAFMVLNFWLAKGTGILDGTNHDVVWFVILIVLGFIPAGKIVGLDDGLSDRIPFLR